MAQTLYFAKGKYKVVTLFMMEVKLTHMLKIQIKTENTMHT
jgi:hypothetical protein